jgi:hypothetical protein
MTSQTMIVVIASLSFSTAWFFAILVFADRRQRRVLEERSALRMHEQMLLQRIQAPATAVDQHVIQTAEAQERMTPRWDEDDDFSKLKQGDTIGFDPLGDQ